MAARRQRTAFRSRSQAISPTWTYLQTGLFTVAPLTKILMGTFVLDGSFEETVMRSRGLLHVRPDGAAFDFQSGAFGMIRVTDFAAAAGIASIPDPFTDGADDGWFVHQTVLQSGELPAVVPGRVGREYMIDSKAMRKVPQGTLIALVYANSNVLSTSQVSVGIRMLSKLTQG